MKKFISMVMAAAMVVSLVPATAFAAGSASLKVVDAAEATKEDAKAWETQITDDDTEIQIKLNDVDTKAGKVDSFDFDLNFDNAELMGSNYSPDAYKIPARFLDASTDKWYNLELVADNDTEKEDESITLTVAEPKNSEDNVIDFDKDDIIAISVNALYVKMDKVSEGKEATVFLSGDFGTTDERVFASVLGEGLKISVKKTVDVAEDEVVELNTVTVEAAVGNLPDKVTLELKSGFEFAGKEGDITVTPNGTVTITDDDEITISGVSSYDEIDLKGIKVEATSAKSGAVATITAKASGFDSAKAEVAKVVDYKVNMTVDEDEDVPVFYSGTDAKNTGLTVDDDHEALEVTIEESFEGAWNMNKDFTLELPEGVYVTEVEAGGLDNIDEAFEAAYQKDDHESFTFKKRTFENTEPGDGTNELTFTLTLVADPDFEGDVKLKLTGDDIDEQEVTIAKFVKPYTVKAEQNDLKIDYRYTAIPTNIVITEAEAGLWNEKAVFEFSLDKDVMDFEDDATFTVDDKSGLEIDDDTKKGVLTFEVTDTSSDEPATVTISDMALFMNRNIPAGPYDLLISTTMDDEYEKQLLFAPDHDGCTWDDDRDDHANDAECYVTDICDFSDVAKEAFVNVVTAGREDDDASFTTKVVVPVGEKYIIAGEKQIAMDVPAYINAAGYTMLPVRAVATALGINNNNVLWDQATRTVTIMYGQRIITMSAGEKVVYVNGSAIPAAAKVEITNDRTFLPMRDLATALGVTDITWDAATKTATLNGNQGK